MLRAFKEHTTSAGHFQAACTRCFSVAPPQIPRRSPSLPQKRKIPNVQKVLLVGSAKGGVGKSTLAVNLALSLALLPQQLRVGILDLDVFGPSIPTLMGLTSKRAEANEKGALIPLWNHGIPTMSIGYLLSKGPDEDTDSQPVVWRGLMVQKAVQQLLFDVDWSTAGKGLDVLVIDLPPGTGDVALSVGQLVQVDGSVIASTPQDVSIVDVKRGIGMFQKVNLPITGLVLNQAYLPLPTPSSTSDTKTIKCFIYGSPQPFRAAAKKAGIPILAELPVLSAISQWGDRGVPYVLAQSSAVDVVLEAEDGETDLVWDRHWQEKQTEKAKETMKNVARIVLDKMTA